MKPDNIRVDQAGVVKLMDFGIAKTDDLSVTATGFTVGTPYYMSPEQIRGDKPTFEVDVYAFGILLFELLTGARPFEAQTVDEIFDLILNQAVDLGPLTRAGIPVELVDLVNQLTAKDPLARPRSFSAVIHRLDLIVA